MIAIYRQAETKEGKTIRASQEEKNRIQRHVPAVLISVVINFAILALVLCTSDLMYETNDDYGIAEMICNSYPYVGFVNYYLCRAIIAVQNILPDINAFVLLQMVASFISFSCITTVFISRNKSRLTNILLSISVICIFAYDHYGSIQFTKTSALLMTSGLILLADNYIHERKIFIYITAYALFYLGVAFRQKGMFPAMAYAGVFLLVWLLQNGRERLLKKSAIKEIVTAVMLIVISLMPYGLDMKSDAINASTPELKYAREYQAQRVKVTDYPLMENYDDKAEEYKAANLSENDVRIVDRFILDYDGAGSLENLKKINEINYPYMMSKRSVVRSVKKFGGELIYSLTERDFTGIHVIILIALAFFFIFVKKPKAWIYVAAIGFLTVAIYIMLYYMQRPQYRAFYVADVGAAAWILYAIASAGRDRESSVPRRLVGTAAIILIAAMIMPATKNIASMRKYREHKIETATVTEYFKNNPDKVFVEPAAIATPQAVYQTPLKKPVIHGNVVATGGWETLSPHELEKLKKCGMRNPVKDLIDNPNAFFFGTYKIKAMKEYYNKWYCNDGETILFEKVDEIDGNGVYRIRKTG